MSFVRAIKEIDPRHPCRALFQGAARLHLTGLAAMILMVRPELRAGRDTSATTAEPRTITLGVIAPPTDPDATSIQRGAQLAVDEANAASAATIRLEIRSEAGQWGSVGNDAAALVTDRHVDGIVTSTDGADTHLILQVSGRTHIPVAMLCADMSVTRAGVPWAVRVIPGNDQQAGALFAATRNADGSSTHWWAVVPAGRPARVIRHDLEFAGRNTGAIVDNLIELDAKASLQGTAKVIAKGAPAGVLLWVSPAEAGSMAAELRSAGYRGRLAGPCTLDSPLFRANANAAADEILVSVAAINAKPDDSTIEFKRRYQARFAVEPGFIAVAAHDAVRVLVEALRATKPDEGYRGFPLTREVIGATGPLHFDAAGNRTDAVRVMTYRNGSLVAR